MKRNYLLYLFLLAFTSLTAFAQVNFTIIPPRDVVAGQQFRVVYRLSNAQGNSLNAPVISGCDLRYGPSTSTSQSMQIINGQTTSSLTIDYSYVYTASKAGEYVIPAATIQVNGKTMMADAKKFKVLPPDSNSDASQVNAYDRQSQTVDRPIGKDDIFVRVILNKSSVYLNEAVECTLKLYTKYEAISSFSATSTPTYEGFLVEDVAVQPELNALEHYNGQNYRTAVLRRYILFPQKTGRLNVTSGSYDVVVQQLERISQGYFYYTRPIEKPVKLNEYTAALNVKPLPSPAPDGFDGAVGNFSISSDLSAENLKTNEAATLTYTISGKGNIKYLKDPQPQFPSEFELYPPSHDVNARVTGSTVSGTSVSEYTFVPQYPGKFTIPEYSFVWFDPSTGDYKSQTVPAFTLDIAKGSGAPRSSEGEAPGIKAKNTDIRHIYLGDKNPSHSHSYLLDSILYWGVYILLTVILIVLAILFNRRNRNRADVGRMRVSNANKVARRHLKNAASCMKSGNNANFYEALLKALWGYFGDKLNLSGSELTRETIAAKLTADGADSSLVKESIDLIDDCEMARYTPDRPELAPDQLYSKAEKVINSVESIKR